MNVFGVLSMEGTLCVMMEGLYKFQIDVEQDVLVEEQGITDKLKVSVGDWVEVEYPPLWHVDVSS